MSAPRIACAVLAAGGSTRLGTPKQLLAIGESTLVRHAVAAACATHCTHVAVVLGACAEDISASLTDLRATQLANPHWALGGLSSSLHVAVDWARRCDADALLVSVCDQPHLNTAHLERLCGAYRGKPSKVASGYANTRGVPALFGSDHFDALLSLRGDRGAGRLLQTEDVTVITWPEGQIDLDTPDDVARFTGHTP